MLTEFVRSGAAPNPGEPPTSLGGAPRAAVISERGDIVASTSPEWAAPSTPYTSIDLIPARTVVGRAFELRGNDTDYGYSFGLDYADETIASAQPIVIDGGFACVLLFQADGVVNARQALLRDFLLRAGIANLVLFAALAVPVLLIAVPVGIFRARRISRRLERLSDATAAMAGGDLGQRVEIEGEDENARFGQRFNEMVAHLGRADRSCMAFASNVSHELRTPVAILQGNLERMIASVEIAQGQPVDATTLEAMQNETLTLGRLIDDLFTLARIEEAAITVEPSPVDLAGCIRRAVDGIAPLAWEQRRVSVESLARDRLPPALGEQARIQQILNNLLYNALRHTPEGGVIVVNAEQDGEEMVVTVTDTGLGIPAEDLPHVFDRYRQVERAERHQDGSGLGLATVKHLVEAMDGRISVESRLNRGTTFRFTLPIARLP